MLLTLLTGIALTISGTFDKVDRGNIDIYHVLLGVRHKPTATVIVSLDAEALGVYPDTPLAF